MSKMRHEKMTERKRGGRVGNDEDGEKESKGSAKAEKYTPDDNVEKEAEGAERKKGGRVKKADGGKVSGEKPKERLDRPKRKSGGRVGSDKSPFSSAHVVSGAHGHSTDGM